MAVAIRSEDKRQVTHFKERISRTKHIYITPRAIFLVVNSLELKIHIRILSSPLSREIAGELEIPIRRQVNSIDRSMDKAAFEWQRSLVWRNLVHSSAFVDFVKHRAVHE